MAMDGTTLDTQDTQANEDAFGRSKSGRGETAFPQLRMTLLAECGSHAVVGAAFGSYRDSERTLAREMTDRLDKKMLLLADRGFIGHDIWATFSQSGPTALESWINIKLEPIKTLKDGSTLALLNASRESARTGAQAITGSHRIRARWRSQAGYRRARYRLITTLLDPREAPALELARLYQERWEIEILLDELKTHLRGRSALLRSKTPDLVKQEAYGLLLCPSRGATNHARRGPVHRRRPRPYFLHGNRADHPSQAAAKAAFPPWMSKARLKKNYEDALKEIVLNRVPERKGDTTTGVKRKMSSYNIRTKAHASIAANASKPKIIVIRN
ncbi:MAG: IS4 family transposase [Fibrobacteres bacterium]|nr:IS4 family transposase [Fibrobacterota bacterium]